MVKGAAVCGALLFDAYLPFFEGFVSFFAFFAMASSCGLSFCGCADADASSIVGIRALRRRVKMNSRTCVEVGEIFGDVVIDGATGRKVRRAGRLTGRER